MKNLLVRCVYYRMIKLLLRYHMSVLVSHSLVLVIPGFGSKCDAVTDPTLMIFIMFNIDATYPFLFDRHYPHCKLCCAC